LPDQILVGTVTTIAVASPSLPCRATTSERYRSALLGCPSTRSGNRHLYPGAQRSRRNAGQSDGMTAKGTALLYTPYVAGDRGATVHP